MGIWEDTVSVEFQDKYDIYTYYLSICYYLGTDCALFNIQLCLILQVLEMAHRRSSLCTYSAKACVFFGSVK